MKRVLSILLIMCMFFSLSVNAEEPNDTGDNLIQPMFESTKTVTDNGNNRYAVTGKTTKVLKNASASTNFSVQYYYGGTDAAKKIVDGYSKTVGIDMMIFLMGGGQNTLKGSGVRTGAKGEYSRSQTYLYNVSTIIGEHIFSCNGGSIRFVTSA